MAARRSRTGCATCRKRKLKCDEAKPVCGPCNKSRRECIPTDGVAFRHEQNAGLNTDQQDDERSLGNFFKYRNNYTEEQLKNFIPVGPNFEWRYITDVYAEDPDLVAKKRWTAPEPWKQQYRDFCAGRLTSRTQELASHSLEALSTAAAENLLQNYKPPVTYADINNFLQGENGGYGPAGAANGAGSSQNNTNIKFLLNPSNTPAAVIDPNLDASELDNMREVETEGNANVSPRSKHGSDDTPEDAQQTATNEEQVALLLKNFDEQTA